jgi:transposase
MSQYQFVGVDVAKDKFDVALQLNKTIHFECFSNDKKGHQALLKWLGKFTTQPWVCMEATGHYSELIADYLSAHQIRVSVVNPLQIKSFARAKLSRNKTDQIDAKLIANYCEHMHPRVFLPRSESHKKMKELSNLLDVLKMQHTQLSNQLGCTQSYEAQNEITKIIKLLAKRIDRVESLIAEIVNQDENLNQNLNLMTSIKGVGKLTAYKVLSHVPHMHNFRNAKQFAAFIGISPRQHQSGNYQGKTTISRLGNSALRKSFYMAAMVAIRHNALIAPFVTRLKQNGKAPKSIICAVMRKLAHLVFGVLKNRRPFDESYA